MKRHCAPLRVELCERRDLPSSSIPLSVTNWTALGPAPLVAAQTPGSLPASGRANGVAVHPTDPNVIYISTAGGGAWKTRDGGMTWAPLTDAQASPFIGCVTLAPSDPNIVYVGTGETELRALSFYGRGVLKSTDAGATWTLLGSAQFDRTAISNIVVHPTNPNIVFAAVCGHSTDGKPSQQTGIYRSTDGGATWTNTTTSITQVDDFTDLERDPSDPNVMWAGVGTRLGGPADGVYRTNNALDPSPMWTLVSNLPSGSIVGRTELAIAPSNNQVLYVSMHSPATDGVLGWFSSTNGGASWVDRTAVVPSTDRMWFCNNLLVDPTNPNIVYFSGTTNLVRSTNGGANWTAINSGADGRGPHVDHHGFGMDSTGRFITVCDGGCYRWTPSTNLWVSLNGINASRTASGALATLQFMGIGISPTDPDFVIGGTQDNGLQRFNDSLGWTLVEGGDGGDVIVDPFNASRMWRANPVGSYGTSAFVRRSTNGGTSWSSIVNGIANAATTTAFYPPMAADPGTQNRVFLGATILYASTNGGDSWGRLPNDTFTFPNTIFAIGVGPANPNVIYVACGASADGTVGAYSANQLFVTTNNGATWIERTPQPGGDFQNFAVDPTNSNIAYAVSANFSPTGDNLFRTTDAGVTWTSISSTLPDAPFYDVLLDPGATPGSTDDVLYVGGDLGVYRSADLGATWAKFGVGLPTAQVRDIEYSSQTKILAIATHGRGIWEILTAPPPGHIFGTVYQDSNANGTRDAGEPGLAGWTVFRDDNNNGTLDAYGTSTINAPGLPIPLVDAGTTTSNLTVAGLSGAITDVNVTLNISHTSVGQLQVLLTDPAGTTVALFRNIGGTGNNFVNTVLDDEAATAITSSAAPFTGTFQPQNVLSVLDAQPPNGTWTLTVIDGTAGTSGTLNSWSIAVTTGESSTTSAADGSYQLRGNPAGTYTIRRILQSGWFGTEPIGGAATVSPTATLGVAGVNFGQTMTPPARVASVVVNGGSTQRSRVTQVQVNFDQIVTLPANPADAFQLRRAGNPALVGLNAMVTNTTTTSVLLTFTGPLTEFGSLGDGRYTLTVLSSQITAGGLALDGDNNGTAGGDNTFGDAQGLFRFFGDMTGDRRIDISDFGLFSLAYLTPANYNSALDFNNDGRIDIADFGQFSVRYFTSLP